MGKSSTKLIGLLFAVLFIVLCACKEDTVVPKPPCYLRTSLPDHAYENKRVVNSLFNYRFDMSVNYSLSRNIGDKRFGFQEIDLGPLNGSLLLSTKVFTDRDSLIKLINVANDLVDEHKIKADRIDFTQIIDPEHRVFGTFFTLTGNVATNYQFYLTDSTHRFIRGEVLLNCRPNYDSLRPTLDYLKVDLTRMINSFRWEN